MQPADRIAYYLPQFYPIEINSRWWGEGYTEWNAVLASQRGCRLPRKARLTPGQLGFYDLRLREVRDQQGQLAKEAGLAAFAIYHYWSAGERIMAEIEDRILADGAPDHPFFLFWANHDWTLAWSGQPDVVTHAQQYDEWYCDDHFDWIAGAFSDPRYYSLDGAPVVGVYRPRDIPNFRRVFHRWRQRALEMGYPGLVILGVADDARPEPPSECGLDSWIQSAGPAVSISSRWRRFATALTGPKSLFRLLAYGDWQISARSFARMLEAARAKAGNVKMVPMVLASWGNVGRRPKRAWYVCADPAEFRKALADAEAAAPSIRGRRLIMINAWNEWGESMALEPSVEVGDAMLRALKASAVIETTPPSNGK